MREMVLRGAVVWGILVVASIEFLSLLHVLNFWGVLLFWLAVLAFGLVFLPKINVPLAVIAARARLCRLTAYVRVSPWRIVTIGALGVFVALIGLVALNAPPNTGDSMTYHMSRVAHWIQDASVANYPTPISRQYEYPPFAEFAITEIQIVAANDRFANLVQFGAYLGCILGVTLIAKRLGLGADEQLLAAVVCATIPMAVIQASGTQNDLVEAFWLTCLMNFVLAADPHPGHTNAFWVGASAGLALLTKILGLVFGLPILVWYALRMWREGERNLALRAIVMACVLIAILNASHSLRYGDILYRLVMQDNAPFSREALTALQKELPARYFNSTLDPRAFVSNGARTVGLELGLPSPQWNAALTWGVNAVHAWLHFSANDERTTYPLRSYNGVIFSLHEDSAGNFVHLVLLGVAVAVLWVKRNPLGKSYVLLLAACLGVFLVLLRWGPWNNRYLTGLFVLAAPLVPLAFSAGSFSRVGYYGLALGLLAAALPALGWNMPRPLVGANSVLVMNRPAQYFANRPDLQAAYENAADAIRASGCTQIGLVLGGDHWEYPLWALLGKNAAPGTFRIEHVNVTNASRLLEAERPPFQPCVIVSSLRGGDTLRYHDMAFHQRTRWNGLQLYVP